MKEKYVQPLLARHEKLVDITGTFGSGKGKESGETKFGGETKSGDETKFGKEGW